MQIRELVEEETDLALDLAWEVFREFEAPEDTPQGVAAFCAAIHEPAYLAQLRLYGAFEGQGLIGVLATRSQGTHIALFFVRGAYQRQGVGKQLFFCACRDNPTGQITVHSSIYAAEIYRHLGFCQTDEEQTADGLRYLSMCCVIRRTDCPCKRTRCTRHGDCVACREHHKQNKKNCVYCQRPTREEKRLHPRRSSH